MHVSATIKLVLREWPRTDEQDGLVSMVLTNEPKGLPRDLPAGTTLENTPLTLRCVSKQWRTAMGKAAQMRANGAPPLLIVEAHIGARNSELLALVKGIQVVEGKKAQA
jgi:hypothetical protein